MPAQDDTGTLDVIVAEYNFVANLIPFYRRIETTALGASVTVVAALVSAFAVLESAVDPQRDIEATLLALAPWLLVTLSAIQIMGMLRIRRAATYVDSHLMPLAQSVTGTAGLLEWERSRSDLLFEQITPRWGARVFAHFFLSSQPIIIAMTLPAIALPIFAGYWHPDGWKASVLWIGYAGAVAALVEFAAATYYALWLEGPFRKTAESTAEPSEASAAPTTVEVPARP